MDFIKEGNTSINVKVLQGMTKDEARKAFGRNVRDFDKFWNLFKSKYHSKIVEKKKGFK